MKPEQDDIWWCLLDCLLDYYYWSEDK